MGNAAIHGFVRIGRASLRAALKSDLQLPTVISDIKGPCVLAAQVLHEEFASSRIVGETHSSIMDLPLSTVVNGNFVSVAMWYDNEMGYASRLAETAQYLAEQV